MLRKTCLIAALILFCNVCVFSQKPPVKFGDVTKEELQMKVYDKDSSAAAVVLADYGESFFQYSQTEGFQIIFERVTRIKILKKEGYSWADFEIQLYHDDNANKEKLSGLKGVTYNLVDGKITESKVRNSDAFEEKYNKNIDLVKIALPDVKEGSVVEITYRIMSDFLFQFQDWTFQYTIPVVLSEYRARIPEFFHYERYMQGYLAPAIYDEKPGNSSIVLSSKERSSSRYTTSTTYSNDKIDFRETSYRWAVHNAPAFKMEPYMTTYKDYISKINFEMAYTKFPNQPITPVMGTWAEISEKFTKYADCGGEVRGNGFLKKTVEEITAGLSTPEQQIGAVCHYVKRQVTWDGTYRLYSSGSLKKILDEKKGSSADINLLLASMLDKKDFKVYPVLLSTRDHGFVRKNAPMASQFNYVVCAVEMDGQLLLLDATEKLLRTGVLPQRCLNGEGLVVADKNERWVHLDTNVKSRSVVNADVAVTPEGNIKGKVTFEADGYEGYNSRKEYFKKGEEEYTKNFFEGRTWTVGKKNFRNSEELQEAFVQEYDLEINDHAMAAGNMIYLKPFVYLFEEENPFKLEKREYPVDFGSAFDRVYFSKITIPEGYDVEELPKPQLLRLPNNAGKYLYNVTRTDNIINITAMLNINTPIFTQLDYPNLREFYNLIVAKQAEQIVLKKN